MGIGREGRGGILTQTAALVTPLPDVGGEAKVETCTEYPPPQHFKAEFPFTPRCVRDRRVAVRIGREGRGGTLTQAAALIPSLPDVGGEAQYLIDDDGIGQDPQGSGQAGGRHINAAGALQCMLALSDARSSCVITACT